MRRPCVPVEHRDLGSEFTDYFPVSIPDFTARGASIVFRKVADVPYWLLNASICPDVTRIIVLKTDRTMHTSATIPSDTCVFTSGRASSYRLRLRSSAPVLIVFANQSKIDGTISADVTSAQPLFFAASTTTKIDVVLSARRVKIRGRQCAVAALPTFRNGSLVDAPLAAEFDTWCMYGADAFVQAGGAMLIIVAGIAAFGWAVKLLIVDDILR
jgi:hypothetical protein